MDLCGHATLAAAHVLTKHLGYVVSPIRFWSRSEELLVTIENDLLTLDFPSRMPEVTEAHRSFWTELGSIQWKC